MRKLFKATFLMGISTVASVAAGFLRAKFTALVLGPSGLGIFSQAVSFFQTSEVVFGLGTGLGVTKYTAEAAGKNDADGIKKIVAATAVLQFISSLALVFIVVAFSRQISQFLFLTPEYYWGVVLLGVPVLFSVMTTSFESVIVGLSKQEYFSLSRVIFFSLGLLLLVFFVGTMKVAGGFYYIAFNAVLGFAVVIYFTDIALRRSAKFGLKDIFKALTADDLITGVRKLISYGWIVLLSSAITWCTFLLTRSLLIRSSGAEANGYYQVAFALVSYYSPFFTNGMWGYLLPKLSGTDSTQEQNAEINNAIKFILIFLTPVIAGLYILKEFVVLLIFTSEFLPALEMFPAYLMGSFFYMLGYVMATVFLSKKRLKIYFLISLAQNILFVILFYLLSGKYGIKGLAFSYLSANLFSAAAMGLYAVRAMKYTVNIQILRIFSISLLVLIAVLFAPGGIMWNSAKAVLTVIFMLMVLGKKERVLVRTFLK